MKAKRLALDLTSLRIRSFLAARDGSPSRVMKTGLSNSAPGFPSAFGPAFSEWVIIPDPAGIFSHLTYLPPYTSMTNSACVGWHRIKML